jgi:hypothetical protein
MKIKYLKILAAVMTSAFVPNLTAYAQGTDTRIGSIAHERVEHGATQATPITKEEAQKKYPPRGGSYPTAQRDPHDPSGVIVSPYPPHEKYDCSKIAHGALVLDTKANKVFVRP